MPNTRYLKGRRKEYKIVHEYRDRGYDIVQRTANSRSPFDVIAIHIKNKRIILIQSKPDSLPHTQITKLYKENKELSGDYKVMFMVM